MRVRRFSGFVLGGGLSGRVSSEASFDVQLVVCMGCAWVSVRSFLGFVFGGNRFLQCNDAKVFFVFLLRLFFCFAS